MGLTEDNSDLRFAFAFVVEVAVLMVCCWGWMLPTSPRVNVPESN